MLIVVKKKSIVAAVWLEKVKVQFGKCPYVITVYSKDRKIVSKALVHLNNALLILMIFEILFCG